MVSLERNSSYRQKLTHKPIVNAFVEFIEGKEISQANFTQLDEVLYKLMVAFRANDKRQLCTTSPNSRKSSPVFRKFDSTIV